MTNRSNRTGRQLSINTSSCSSRYGQRYDQSPEPTFSPTGLLGNRYDERIQEMEARSKEAKQAPKSPFTGGLLQSLAEFEEQRLIRTSHVPSYESFGRTPTRAASTSATSYRSQPPSQDFTRPMTLSAVSVRTDSIYCAQTGITPPPLLNMTSTPQRQPWRERNTQDIRSPIGRTLGLPENSIQQWNTQSSSLSRSQSVAVRPASNAPALERRTSSATAPVRSTRNEAAQRIKISMLATQDLSFMNDLYSTPETRTFKTAPQGAHLLLQLRKRTTSFCRLKIHQNHVMPIPHKEVMLVDVTKLDTELMQPAQSLLAAVDICWPSCSRAFYPLSDEAYHATVSTLGEMTQKLGTDTAVTDPLIRGCLDFDRRNFPRPDR
ncbi:hypothetical protein HG530_005609 [Fusarium avenaceum]|nr:hypothetical protein HG530_005609 [Fusarium avenaceum]